MPHPYLLFCPYVSMPQWLDKPIEFAGWELGPLRFFEGRWADSQFKVQATNFLHKFVGIGNMPIDNPALLCRKGKQLDGQKPSDEEVRALELSLAFAFIDCNPRRNLLENSDIKQAMRTTENAELHLWSIGDGNVTINTGYLIPCCIVDATANPVMRPPLDLHIPSLAPYPDPLVLTGIYATVLRSLRSPGGNSTADKIRVAVDWFAKAWHNSKTVLDPERLVFLKTAFEALTGTSDTCKSARKLREVLEALPHTTERDAEISVWSPAEQQPVLRTWINKKGQCKKQPMTDLETWFMEFGATRNAIVHEGELRQGEDSYFTYPSSNPVYQPVTSRTTYHGPFFFTAEFLLRGVIKVLLSKLVSTRKPTIAGGKSTGD